jgi:hypothetical protein
MWWDLTGGTYTIKRELSSYYLDAHHLGGTYDYGVTTRFRETQSGTEITRRKFIFLGCVPEKRQ